MGVVGVGVSVLRWLREGGGGLVMGVVGIGVELCFVEGGDVRVRKGDHFRTLVPFGGTSSNSILLNTLLIITIIHIRR